MKDKEIVAVRNPEIRIGDHVTYCHGIDAPKGFWGDGEVVVVCGLPNPKFAVPQITVFRYRHNDVRSVRYFETRAMADDWAASVRAKSEELSELTEKAHLSTLPAIAHGPDLQSQKRTKEL